MRRCELTDEQWDAIADLLPGPGAGGGHPWRDHRQVLNGMMWILHTGAQWRELPERYGPWKTVYGRLHRWRRQGSLSLAGPRTGSRGRNIPHAADAAGGRRNDLVDVASDVFAIGRPVGVDARVVICTPGNNFPACEVGSGSGMVHENTAP